MVKSEINTNINYPERRKIDPEDMEFDAQPWEVNIKNEDVLIALGKEKYTYSKYNVIFFPIYLIKNDRVDCQIGVYETKSNKLASLLDEDGDIDIESLGEPLLYSFVNRALLHTEKEEQDDEEEEVEDEDEDEDPNDPDKKSDSEEEDGDEEIIKNIGDDTKTVVIDESFDKMPELSEQSEAEAKLEREKVTGKRPWVAKYMGNQNYEVEDVGGGGDCLFHVIRAALETVGKKTSVSKLRNVLAREVTQDIFEQYKNIFDGIKTSMSEEKTNMKMLVAENKKLKADLKTSKDRTQQIKIIDDAKEVKKKYDRAKQEYKATSLMFNEYVFMEGVTNINAFKKVIKTCKFWGETWAISTLERVLNIKLILLSEEAYTHGDLANVLQCGQLNDEILEKDGSFEPEHYIIANFLGWHYQLIKYKDRSAFNFKEIPYDLKTKVVDKCMERNAGPYELIPDFKNFKEKISGKASEDDDEPQDDSIKELGGVKDDNPQNDLYDDDIVFQFYSKSSGKPLPGKGSGESIPESKRSLFTKLAGIPNWRRKLSNFATGSFECDGKEWNSVEHYYQANKFKNTNSVNGFYDTFSLDSGTDLSKDPSLAKAAGGKSGKFKGKQIRPDNVQMDMDFMGKRRDSVMENGMLCKFSQIPEYKEVLLLTHKAKLTHFMRGHPPIVFNDLMRVRSKLNTQSTTK